MSTITTTISHGILFNGVGSYASPLTITSTGFVNATTSASNNAALYANEPGTALTLTNDGRISAGGTYIGVLEGATNGFTFDNAGTVSAVNGYGVSLALAGPLTNSGTIISTGNVAVHGNGNLYLTNVSGGLLSGDSYGVSAVRGTLTNSGTIQVTGTHATAMYLTGGGDDGTVVNDGLMSASYEVVLFRNDGSLDNSGTIASTGRFGVRFAGSASVTNSGTISATNALVLLTNGTVSNTGTGLITGLTGIGISGSGSVVNAATIDATDGTGISLGDGGNISNAAGGIIIGNNYHAVYVQSGAATVVNLGTIVGKTGVGFYSSTSAGTLSQTVIDGGTIIGNGGTAIAFGGGNDLLQFQPSPSVFIQGTVNGGGGTNTLEFTGGTLTGVNAYFANFSNGTVNASANAVLAGSVTFGSSVTLTDSGALTDAGTLTNDGTLVVDPPITVTGTFINSSIVSAPGTYTAFYIANGGVLSNTSTGTISAGSGVVIAGSGTVSIANLGTIANTGTQRDGINLAAGSITNGASNATNALIRGGDEGIFVQSGAGTVINFGSIISGANHAIYLFQGGFVSNASSGTIAANNTGVVLNAAGTIINQGYITGNNSGIATSNNATIVNQGTILGAGNNGVIAGSNVSVNNQGTIIGARDYGVLITGTGSVTNSGVIIGDGQVGVDVLGIGLVSNYGTITSSVRPGVEIKGGTVIDAGTIAGVGEAVKFYGTNSNLLVLEKGYALIGGVYGSSSASNTLELLGTSGANAVTANYNGLNLTNFGTVGFAPGAGNYATLQITNSAVRPGTIANFTGAHDTIDLTTLSFVTGSSSTSFDTSSHKLTVTAGTSSVTLKLGAGSYTGLGWAAEPDGTGGTDIIPAALPAISGAVANQGIPVGTSTYPFSGVSITDPGGADTVTATLAPGGTGTFSNGAGTYVVSGTPGVVTTKLQALGFTPIAQPNQYVSTTDFTISVTGAGGSVSDSTANVTSVQQILGLATVSPSNVAITVSPDGTGFAAPISGDTNEAVVRAPTGGSVFALPTGFQAEFLGGSANVKLTDKTIGNALLVGNQGNDTLVANVNNDTVQAGSGKDTLFGGAAQVTLIGGSGNALMIATNGTSDLLQAGTGADTIYTTGSGTITGSSSNLIGLFGGATSNLVTLTGKLDTVGSGGSVTISAAPSASDALIFGSSSSTVITDQGTADTIVAGVGATTVNASRSSLVFGASAANLQVTGGANTPTIIGGTGSASITAGSGGLVFAGGSGSATISGAATLFGSPGNKLNYTGATGNAVAVFDSGAETIDASTSSTANVFWGGLDSKGSDVMIGGSGDDSLIAGTGADTMTGGAGNNLFLFISSSLPGGADTITDFTANDSVLLSGYGATAASAALSSAVSSSGNTTLTLSDGTSIMFLGVASASTLSGHVFST